MCSCKQKRLYKIQHNTIVKHSVYRLHSNCVIRYTLLNTKELKYDTYALRQVHNAVFLCFVIVNFVHFVHFPHFVHLLLYTSVIFGLYI